MGKRFYLLTRDLHLYAGLFLSPFILVFAISVFFLVHPRAGQNTAIPPVRVVSNVPITEDVERLSGRNQVNRVHAVLDRLGIRGEINFIRHIAKEHRLIFPVLVPGRETTVDLNLQNRSAVISERHTGLPDALIYLHKMPGPHNANIRGNSAYMQMWRWLADVAAYGLLFLTLSGVYLWAILRAERRIGFMLLLAGATSFFGAIYAISG